MDSEAFSVWQKQFDHSMKLFEMVSDEEKSEALNHIKIKVAEYEFEIVKSVEQNMYEYLDNGEYFEEYIKKEGVRNIKEETQ